MPVKNLLYFRPLGSRDATLIHRLQRRLFSPALTEPLSEVVDILRTTEEYMLCNLSFGLFDDTRMVGYVFAYVETESIFHDRPEEVIYLKEIALLPGYENYLRSLFFKLYELWHAFTPGMPLEAHVMPETLEQWRRLVRMTRYFGVTLTDSREDRKAGRPPYRLLRLDVDRTAANLAEKPKPLPGGGWTASNGLTVAVVSDARQWLSLRDAWTDLLESTADNNVFQSFEYLWQWWKHYGFWNDLRVFVIRDGAEVVGVAPMMREYFTVFGRTMRKLVFISTPMDMNRPKLLFGNNAASCLSALLAWFHQHADEWDIVDIDEQPANETTQAIRRNFEERGCLVADTETLCPYVALEGSWERFLAARTRKMRSNINRLRRRLSEQGELRLRRFTTWPEVEAGLKTHCEVESRSWKAKKMLDLASDKSSYFFHRSLARAFGQGQQFELRVLECGTRPIASTYGLVHGRKFQSLKIAHDADFDRYSPGTVLESFELEDLFGKDLDCYEFMGSFLANKLRWTTEVHKTVNLHVYRRRPRLALFYFVYFVLKRQVKSALKRTGQFERVDRLLNKLGKSPIPQY